jgi:hypothetical protein
MERRPLGLITVLAVAATPAVGCGADGDRTAAPAVPSSSAPAVTTAPAAPAPAPSDSPGPDPRPSDDGKLRRGDKGDEVVASWARGPAGRWSPAYARRPAATAAAWSRSTASGNC